jgi:hypothetical protein
MDVQAYLRGQPRYISLMILICRRLIPGRWPRRKPRSKENQTEGSQR